MRTQLLQSLFLILFLPFCMVGQDCFDEILPNGGDCNSALFLCGSEIDGWMGTLSTDTTDLTIGSHPDNLCNNAGDIDNIQWFSFIPCEASVELNIIPSSCTAVVSGLFGLQTGVYEDCTFANPIFCYAEPGTASINMELDDLVPGNIYYLFVDGYASSVCDFEFEVVSGIDISPPVQPDPVNVDIVVTNNILCEGDSLKASFEVPDLNIGGFSCGNITGEDLDYVACFDWEVTGTPDDPTVALVDAYDVLFSESSACYELIFYEAGSYQVNTNARFNPAVFGGANSCTIADVNFEPVNIIVEERVLEVLSLIEVCEGDSILYCGNTYFADTVVECNEACTTFLQPIAFMESTMIDLGTFFICEGVCFEYQGVDYCDPDFYEIIDNETCTTAAFAVGLLDYTIDYGGDDEINCDTESIIIDPSYTINNEEILNYEWVDQDNNLLGNNATLEVTQEGTYTVIVTSADISSECLVSHTVDITESSGVPQLNITPPIITCDDDQGIITMVSDISIATSTWTGPNDFGSNDISPMVVDTGIYEVIVVGVNGCTAVRQVTVKGDIDQPQIMVVSENLDCNLEVVEASYTANVAIRSQEWSGPDMNSIDESISTGTVGTYTLTVTAFNGCTATESFEILDIRDWPVIDAGPDQIWNCSTENISLTAEIPDMGPFSYEWNTIVGDPLDIIDNGNVIANAVGIYELVVTNTDLGCTSRDTVQINLNENVPTAVIGEIADPQCFDVDNGYILIESVTGGVAPYTMTINGDVIQDNEPMGNLPDGIYELLVVDGNDCSYTQSIELIKPDSVLITVPAEVEIKYYATGQIELQTNVTDSEIDEINWYDIQDNLIGQGRVLEFGENSNTTYLVELITIDGCVATQEISIRVDTNIEIYVPNVFSPNGDGANDIFWVQGKDEDVMIESLLIYDRWGNKVYEAEDMPIGEASRGWDGNFNGSPVNPGVYVYVLEVLTASEEIVVKSGDVTVVR